MERTSWTNERLDDLSESIRTGFGRVDHDVRELRSSVDQDMRELRAETNAGFTELRAEMNAGFAELRAALHRTQLGLIVGFLGMIAAILARA
ncbi:MAG: hypothetical protein ACRDKH_05280 [Solirubrobacterales bacterium]